MNRISHSFYILMVDFKHGAAKGMEAIVQPEKTRRSIVEEVRGIISEGRNSVAFVKFVDGNYIEDCTDDIVAAAEAQLLEAVT
jgi:hypothetical protein